MQLSSPNPKPHPQPLFSGIKFPSFRKNEIKLISVSNLCCNHIHCYNIRRSRKVTKIGWWTIEVHYYSNFPFFVPPILLCFASFVMLYIIRTGKNGYNVSKIFYLKFLQKTIQTRIINDIIWSERTNETYNGGKNKNGKYCFIRWTND